MYFESSLDGFIFVHKKQKVHSVDAKKTIVKKVKNIVHLILTFKVIIIFQKPIDLSLNIE